MKFIAFLLCTLSLAATAATLNMKPGLWDIEVEVVTDGKKINVSDEMSKAMAKMTPEQRKKMEVMMGKAGVGAAANNGVRTCFSKEMLNPEQFLSQQNKEKCTTTLTKNTPNELVGKFNCKDGSKGDAKWTIQNMEKMDGLINLTAANGKTTKMNYTGKFVKADCGDVKPPVHLK